MAPNRYELVIIGSGPAAMSAAIYAGREKLAPVIFERSINGGAAAQISHIENYPGFDGTGQDLMQIMRRQAEQFGAQFCDGECELIQSLPEGGFALTIDGEEVFARAVIVATGTEARKLEIPGDDLPGISSCATCDAPLVEGEDIIVVGAGNSAVQEAFFLLRFCRTIKLVVRSQLRCSAALREQLAGEPRIEVIANFQPAEVARTEDAVLTLVAEDGRKLSAKHIFTFIGSTPATNFVPSSVRAQSGGIHTDSKMCTQIPGLFAAGDCRETTIRQVIVAAGEGAIAAISARHYLQEQSNA